MLAIGRGLMSRPRILLLDEPSMGLSPLMVKEVFQIIEAIRKEGTTLLLVEQNAADGPEIRRPRLRSGKRSGRLSGHGRQTGR